MAEKDKTLKNKKAYFDYFVEDTYEAGLSLVGTEVKSARNGSVNLKDSYIRIKNGEAYVINMHIAKYDNSSIFNHDEYRERKLLLHKKEISKIKEAVSVAGLTVIPLEFYFKNDHAKLLIGLCKGKKLYDKRETIKKKDLLREESRR